MEPDKKPEEVDYTKFRYTLYARASEEDKDRQIRSTPDQIKDCKKLATDLNLRITGQTVEERGSAKIAGKRKLFSQLLEDVEDGKCDAILAWSPDRLCRNMLEGGQLINLLDEGKLKDLRFVTHHFTNDATGKLTLGILFSIAKHFSDDLARKVGRGVKGNFKEGKSSGTPKYGYDRNEDTGLYRPNKYFEIVQQCWHMRAEGATLEECVEYLNQHDYHRLTKKKGKKQRTIRPSTSALSEVFGDPIYYGILIQAKQEVDLREVMPDFEPMITPELYRQVQEIGYRRARDKNPAKRTTFYPLHGFVYCAVCNNTKHMIVGKNKTGSGQHVLSYRCDNPGCTRKPKSLRANKVFSSIYSVLENFELSGEAYERYSNQLDELTSSKVIEIRQQLHSKRTLLQHSEREIKEISEAIIQFDKDDPVFKVNNAKIAELADRQDELQNEIKELEAKVSNPERIKLTKAEFLNIIKTAHDKMKAGTAVEKDRLCRILFLNLRVDN